MGKGNLTEKQKHKIVSSARLMYDRETADQLASLVSELGAMLQYFYYDLPVDNNKRPAIKKALAQTDVVLKRYREGPQ